MNPWKVVDAFSFDKDPIMKDLTEQEMKAYPRYIINKVVSHFPDCIFDVNELNSLPYVDGKMHFDYFFYALTKKKRYSKWIKAEKEEYIGLVKEFFNYSELKAREALKILSIDQLKEMKELLQKT